MYLVSLQGHLHVGLARLERRADRVQGGHPLGVRGLEALVHVGAHAGHDVHRGHDVGAVGDLHAELGVLRVRRSHAERDDEHRATTHAAPEELGHGGLHLGRVHPVVGDPRVLRVDRTDEGALLDPGDVVRVGGGVERVRLLLRVEPGVGAGLDELIGEARPLLLRPVAPHHPVRGGELGYLGHPVQHLLALQRGIVEPRDGRCGRHTSCHSSIVSPVSERRPWGRQR